jgi:AcrR family transcriptional regulator
MNPQDITTYPKNARIPLTRPKRLFYTVVSSRCLDKRMAGTAPPNHDEARGRLLKAAARLFAERGFNHVSVREICKEAGTNVASVNYYFRDKLGLYRELIGSAAEGMDSARVAALDAGVGDSPEEQLRAYVRSFLHQLLDPSLNKECWIEKLIAREMTEPTPALDLIIEKGIKPARERVNKLVAEVLGLRSDDARVEMSAGSIHAMCLSYRSWRTVSERMFPGLRYTPEVIDAIAKYVADFSLAGMRALAQQKKEFEPIPGDPVTP